MTLDQLTPEARRLVAKMARAEARTYFAERQEAENEYLQKVRDQGIERLSAQLVEECKRQIERERRRARHHASQDAPLDPGVPPVGMILDNDTAPAREGTRCGLCGALWEKGIKSVADGLGGWNHRYTTECPPQTLRGKAAASEQPQGECLACDQPWEPGRSWRALTTKPGWMHTDPLCVVTPMMRKESST